MIRTHKTFLAALFTISTFLTFAFDSDSSEASSIDFVAIEATLSSKIIHFKWDVNAEKSGDFFIIEKSTDKTNWKKVSQVKSIENHKERRTYSVSEINPVEGKSEYFRLSRIDKFKNIEVLDVVNVNQPILRNLSLIPVQGSVSKEIRLSYDSMISAHGKVEVVDSEGLIIHQATTYNVNGYNHFSLNIKGFPAGRYLIIVKDEFNNKTTRSLNVYHEGNSKRKSRRNR